MLWILLVLVIVGKTYKYVDGFERAVGRPGKWEAAVFSREPSGHYLLAPVQTVSVIKRGVIRFTGVRSYSVSI